MVGLNRLRNVLLSVGLVAGAAHFALAAQPGAGTYSGTYAGADHGSVTVTIDEHGAVSCELASATGKGRRNGVGAITSQSEYEFIFSCDTPASPDYMHIGGGGPPGGELTGGFDWGVPGRETLSGNFKLNSYAPGTAGSQLLSPQAISGLWYDPASDGTGFNLIAAENGLFATYYGRSAAGAPLWLISTEVPVGALKKGVQYTTILGATTAGTFAAPAYEVANWGQLDISFSSCSTATATLSGKDGVQKFNLKRLTTIAGVSGC